MIWVLKAILLNVRLKVSHMTHKPEMSGLAFKRSRHVKTSQAERHFENETKTVQYNRIQLRGGNDQNILQLDSMSTQTQTKKISSLSKRASS